MKAAALTLKDEAIRLQRREDLDMTRPQSRPLLGLVGSLLALGATLAWMARRRDRSSSDPAGPSSGSSPQPFDRGLRTSDDVAGVSTKRAKRLLVSTRDDLRHADQKASTILAVLGVVFGVGASAHLSGNWQASSSLVAVVLFAAGVGCGALSLVAAGVAVWPRYSTRPRSDQSVSYWGHVVKIESDEGLRERIEASGSEPVDVYFELRVLSKIVHRKYRAVRFAMGFAMASFLLMASHALMP